MNFNPEIPMKNILIALTAIAAITFAPTSASALGDKEAAILGGLLGGLVIGAVVDDALDNNRHYDNVRYNDRHRGNSHGYTRKHGSSCGCDTCRASRSRSYNSGGHWTYRSVKVWIPGHTSYYYDECGRRIRHYERGYWTYRKEKVWVSNRSRW